MYANNRLNDCTTVAIGHKIMAASGWAGHLHVPTEASVVALYWATGTQDDGRFPNAVLNAWRERRAISVRTSPRPTSSSTMQTRRCMRTAAYLFAGVYFCANLPANLKSSLPADTTTLALRARRGFGAGLMGRARVHRRRLLRERRLGRPLLGPTLPCTKRWLQEYVYLAFAILSTDELQRVNGKNPQGIDLATLRADLASSEGGL